MTTVFTIGYEGTDIERFIQTLKYVGVRQLVDVRAVPISRKPGFSKNKLRERIEAEGIRYLHLGALGDPKPGREAARAGHFNKFRRIYGAHLSKDDAQTALSGLAKLVKDNATCLMCFERDPTECHRTMIVEALPKVSKFELFADDPERYVRNARKLPRHRSSQGSSAA